MTITSKPTTTKAITNEFRNYCEQGLETEI